MREKQPDSGERFTRLLLENRKRIFGFVLSLMPSGSDVDDVFQEVCVVMWRKFDQFEHGTNFAAWALRIARYEVMDYCAREKRRTARLSDTAIDAVLERYSDPCQDQAQSDGAAAMENCLEKLQPGQLDLIRSYYNKEQPVVDIAGRLEISGEAVYKRLNRTRRQLFRCVQSILVGRREI